MEYRYQGEQEQAVNTCLNAAAEAFCRHLGDNLVGLYLHGSMAMGSFHPWSSDIDLLAVVAAPPREETKLALAYDIMAVAESGQPLRKIEFSIVTAEAAAHPKHPIPYVQHYSPTWHDAYREGRAQPVLRGGEDADLAAHFTVTRRRGVALLGAPIAQTFGPVPRQDYLRAIWYDIAQAPDDIHSYPVYVILNLCRTLRYLREDFVGSKAEGAAWALCQPELARWHALIAAAAQEYAGAAAHPYDQEQLSAFAGALMELLKPAFAGL